MSDSSKIRQGPSYIPNVALKAKYALYSALIFFVVANPEPYRVTQSALGSFITVASTHICLFHITLGPHAFPPRPVSFLRSISSDLSYEISSYICLNTAASANVCARSS